MAESAAKPLDKDLKSGAQIQETKLDALAVKDTSEKSPTKLEGNINSTRRLIAYSDLTLSVRNATVDKTELIYLVETSVLYTADPGKVINTNNNNAENTINYF